MINVISYFLMFLLLVETRSSSLIAETQIEILKHQNELAIQRLQEHIQIDTSAPENIENAVEFWRRQATELGLPFAVHRPAGLPICVITVKGSKPELPCIMLNSHADVVPVDAAMWTYPPFSAHIDEKGFINGRGTQDCKSVGIQYLEAMRELSRENITLERTVYLTIMPDEETGGLKGMVPFVKTKEFKAMNVGFALDKGMPSSGDVMYALYTDKRPWQMKFEIQGVGGHGSLLKKGSTIEQVHALINAAMAYRNQQLEIMKSKAATDYGAYTTLNINMIHVDHWMSELGSNTNLEFLRRINSSKATAMDESNKYWVAMRDTMSTLNLTLMPIVCPGTTDMMEIRSLGIPAFGFTTTRNVDLKAHDIDEYIPIDTYLEGIAIYATLIQRLASLP